MATPKLTPGVCASITRLKRAGLGVREIGRRLGISHFTVGQFLRGKTGPTANEFGQMLNYVNPHVRKRLKAAAK